MGVYRQGIPSTAIQLATTPGNVLYTCPVGTRAQVIALEFLNTSSGAVTVTVHICRSGDTIAAKNQIWNANTIPATATAPRATPCYEAQVILNPGDFIQAFASAGTAITPMGGVVEYT